MITLDEAKKQLNISHDDDDSLIADLITESITHVENYTNRIIETAAVAESFDGFSTPLVLTKTPLVTIQSITYLDGDEVEQTLATYTLDRRKTYPEITPAYGESWPSTSGAIQSVTVNYTAGYSDMPGPLRRAALMILSSLYEQRENHLSGTIVAGVPVSAEYLMNSYRIPVL